MAGRVTSNDIGFDHRQLRTRFHRTFYTIFSLRNSLLSQNSIPSEAAKSNGAKVETEAPFTTPPLFHGFAARYR